MRNTHATFRRLSVIAVLVLLVAGCGGDDDASDDQAAPGTVSSAVPFDRSFIDAMVPHHRAAIDMANEAKTAGLSRPELIEVADDIIASQQREIDQMLGWRESWYGSRDVDPDGAAALGLSDAEMGMDHDPGMIAEAEDVDAAFAAAMIPHHESAVAMARLAQERGQHDEVKELADEIIEAQEREIEVLRPHAEGAQHGS